MKFFVLLLFLGVALAAPKTASTRDVVGYIATAQREIFLAAPVLRVKDIAEALRIAKVERGVKVYLLTGQRSNRDAASYWWSLHAAGCELRTVETVRGD
jgi:hypothetical protein